MDQEVPMLTGRYKNILGAIIKDYIRRAEPVGSKAIARRYDFGVSPATIRNIMADLEKEGFLSQPHTSAGRIPTERGFRFYVDTLLELDELKDSDKRLLSGCCEKFSDQDNMLTETTKTLSILTSCTGLAFVLKKETFVIRDIKLLPMDITSVVLVFVSEIGNVRTRFVPLGPEAAGLNLERASNYLNAIGRGLTIRQLRAKIITEMHKEKNLYDELLAGALKVGDMALRNDGGGEDNSLYVEGKTNILEYPEFREDFDKMKKLFSAFEEKSLIVKILDRSMEDDRIHIYMGSESSIEWFEGLSFVTVPYGRGDTVLGTLGVIGPVRMDYAKIVPLVSYTAGLVEKVF